MRATKKTSKKNISGFLFFFPEMNFFFGMFFLFTKIECFFRYADLLLYQCWVSVADSGPALKQRWAHVSCLMDPTYSGSLSHTTRCGRASCGLW